MSDKNKKILKISLISFGCVVAVALIIVISVVWSFMDNITYMKGDDLKIPDNLDSIVLDDESGTDADILSGADQIDDELMQEIDSEVSDVKVDENNLRNEKGVKNILVLGIDSRKVSSTKSRSDVMIILTINENTKKLVMSSIMRDTYVSIPGKSTNTKINAACAYGGAPLAVKTVESTFGIKIDNFIVVNFYSFMDIVDALGGVDVEINNSEKKYVNMYIREINRKNGLSLENGQLTKTGKSVHLTGKQAMGYVRVRYSGNGDYERTERQREVMEQIIKKARTAKYGELIDILDSVTENIATDMTSMELIGYAANAGKYLNYDIEQLRIPVNGTYKGGIYKGAWVLRIDFKKNRDALYKAVFGSAELSD